MRTLLIFLTAVEILLVIAALAFYLWRIATSLRASSALLAKVTFGVRAIETQCASIGPSVVKVNGQLRVIADTLDTLATKAERLGQA